MTTITFDGHMRVPQRQVTMTQNQLYQVFEAMKDELLSHVTYSTLSENNSMFPADKIICDLCKAHEVDFRLKSDRVSFFKAIIDKLENPYE
jgi:hypothetical protein